MRQPLSQRTVTTLVVFFIGLVLSIVLLLATPDLGQALLLLLGLVAGIALYFAPSIVAARRQHRNLEAIFVLNFLAGWTFIGWIAAAVWAHTNTQTR